MWKELQCLFFPTALIYTMIKLFFFALSNACSEYRFEVTPELEWLFLMLNLPITQTQHAKSANTCPHLTYLHLPLFDTRKLFENDLWYKDDLQAQDDEIFVSSSNVYFYWL